MFNERVVAARGDGVFRLPADGEANRVGPDQPGLIESTDAGVSWSTLSLAGEVAGELHRSTDGGGQWSSEGTAPGTPTAFAADGDYVYVVVQDDGIVGSRDDGASWDRLYP